MTLRRAVLMACLAAPAGLLPARALPALVTVEFEGVISEVSDPHGLLGGLAAGETFSGFYAYDDAVAPSDAYAPSIRLPDGSIGIDPEPEFSSVEYRFFDIPGAGVFLESGGLTVANFESASLPLVIDADDRDSHRIDDVLIASLGVPSRRLPDFSRSPAEDIIEIELAGPDLLNAVDPPLFPLPIYVPDLSKATTRNEFVYIAVDIPLGSNDSYFRGSLTRLARLPEPATALLLIPFGLVLTMLRSAGPRPRSSRQHRPGA